MDVFEILRQRPDYEPGSWLAQIRAEIGAIEEVTDDHDEREIVAEWIRPDERA